MNEEITQVIEEKFTRCPECRSFSVRIIDDLSPKEKLKSFFVPVTVQVCGNCSHRFVTIGSIGEGIKKRFRSLTATFPRKCVTTAVFLALAAIIVTIVFMSGDKSKESTTSQKTEPLQTQESKPVITQKNQVDTGPSGLETPAGNKVEEKPVKPEEKQISSQDKTAENQEKLPPKEEIETPNPSPQLAGEIILTRNRFGVNWRPIGKGVQITRISNGPVKKAGLNVGDIILEVDGENVKGEGAGIELARDQVFNGKRKEVILKVQRDDKTLFYKMIKSNPNREP